ncbi:hypothetical protein V6N12_042087 [Hibiscus sabdariffa]|uniref:Uncharacterized protein n=1 Tax=Hibiscus sabdariffa TaxID=183260 RepID=A0ABR2EG04_9ROSI
MASLRFLPHRESTAEPRGMSTGGSSGSISSSFCLSDVFFSQKMNVHENVVRILLLSQLYGFFAILLRFLYLCTRKALDAFTNKTQSLPYQAREPLTRTNILAVKIHWQIYSHHRSPSKYTGKFIRTTVLESLAPNNDPFLSNIKLQVGDCKLLDFWSDKWIENACLKELFPRISALATNKIGKVANFGHCEETVRRWDVSLRRPLFDCELGVWEAFIQSLE